MDKEFERFRRCEDDWWAARGVRRDSAFLVRPSGSLTSAVACHLFNPTFNCYDPRRDTTDDGSNPSILQINRAGFSSKNCLIFDHFARRDDSETVDNVNPADLCQIHEMFLTGLRNHMQAVVEICWGSKVRARMERLLKHRLVILPLWGEYDGVQLGLELSEDQKHLSRFIMFVHHPQFFFRVKNQDKSIQPFRDSVGARQDISLKVAALLGGLLIPPKFYQESPLLFQSLSLTKCAKSQRDSQKFQALIELETTFQGHHYFDLNSSILRFTKEEEEAISKVMIQSGGLEALDQDSSSPGDVSGNRTEVEDRAQVSSLKSSLSHWSVAKQYIQRKIRSKSVHGF